MIQYYPLITTYETYLMVALQRQVWRGPTDTFWQSLRTKSFMSYFFIWYYSETSL